MALILAISVQFYDILSDINDKLSQEFPLLCITNIDDIEQLYHEPDGFLTILPLVKVIYAGFISISVALNISQGFTFFFKVTFHKLYFFYPKDLKKADIIQVTFQKFYFF